MAELKNDNVTVLGPETTLKGELTVKGAARILGTLEGVIRSDGEVLVGPTGQVTASIQAQTIQIDGVVQGDVIARERLQLGSKARLIGDVTAAAFAVAEGATFAGRCNVGPDAVSAAGRATERPVSTEIKPAAARVATRAPQTGEWLEGQTAKGDWLAAGAQPGGKAGWMNTPANGAQ